MEIVTLANLNVRKGYEPFLDVVEEVLIHYPSVKFAFVGRDDLNGSIQKCIADKGLEKSVSCVGFQPDVRPFLQRAKIFVLPSLWGEGCPTSILEAMAYNLPVVAHSIDGIPELVQHGVNGMLYEVGDVSGMVSGIVELLGDDNLLCSLGNAGRAKVQSDFLISSCAANHQLTLGKLCVA